jgi:hypothetical protein
MVTYTISELPLPAGADPQASSEGMGVNADGVAAGTVWDAAAHPTSEAVIWPESASPTVLDIPPPDTRAWAINDAGDAVGFGFYPPTIHPFLYRHDTGQIEDFSKQLPAPYSFAIDLNNDEKRASPEQISRTARSCMTEATVRSPCLTRFPAMRPRRAWQSTRPATSPAAQQRTNTG